MAAILYLPENKAFPEEDLGGVLCVVLTFVVLTFLMSNLTLTFKMTSVSPLINFNCEQMEALKKLGRKDILYVALRCLDLK